jgi:hypothetical protein
VGTGADTGNMTGGAAVTGAAEGGAAAGATWVRIAAGLPMGGSDAALRVRGVGRISSILR